MNNFLFGGVSAGLKTSKKKDLGLIFCEQPCVVGGVFTQNRYPSPHVLYGREILPSQNIRAVLVNSGQSLAGMGKQGITINKAILKITSQKLQIPADTILTSSTGVIGAAPDIQKIEKALPFLEKTLTFNPEILLFKSVVIIALAKFSGLKVSVFSKKGKAFSIF